MITTRHVRSESVGKRCVRAAAGGRAGLTDGRQREKSVYLLSSNNNHGIKKMAINAFYVQNRDSKLSVILFCFYL